MGLFPRFILKLYTDEISIIDESLPVMYVTLAALLIFSISIIVFQSIVGIGATKITLIAEMVCVFLYMIYTYACVFIWKSSLAMAWGGELLYWVVMLILCLLYLRSGKWKQLNKL
jgi:Na+-driven multidrug efflux pump